METEQNLNKITCEQVYNVWATEPHLIQILDLRDAAQFQDSHIPGAKNISPEAVFEQMDILGEKLVVLIAPENIEKSLRILLQDKRNYVFMSECRRWQDSKHPLTGVRISINDQMIPKGEISMGSDILFQQLFEPESSTYTYIIADKKSKEAAIIDPVLETVDRDLKLIEEMGLRLMYVLDTHIHADHVTGAGEIRKRTQAKSGVSHEAKVACVDIPLEDGQELLLGDKKIKVIATPGHTDTCLSYAFEGMVFTGDSLLIRGCGRTDFQQGSSDKLYESVQNKLFRLPDETTIYPAHDYKGLTSSTIGLEKQFNPRLGLGRTKDEFKKIMSDLKLANPKKIQEAVPANLKCGLPQTEPALKAHLVNGVPEVNSDEVLNHLPHVVAKKMRLIDVRRPDEFNAEYGHIQGAELVTLGPDLMNFLEKGDRNQEIVFICRSGSRSETATVESLKLGYKNTKNMVGGMIDWNENRFPIQRNK